MRGESELKVLKFLRFVRYHPPQGGWPCTVLGGAEGIRSRSLCRQPVKKWVMSRVNFDIFQFSSKIAKKDRKWGNLLQRADFTQMIGQLAWVQPELNLTSLTNVRCFPPTAVTAFWMDWVKIVKLLHEPNRNEAIQPYVTFCTLSLNQNTPLGPKKPTQEPPQKRNSWFCTLLDPSIQ